MSNIVKHIFTLISLAVLISAITPNILGVGVGVNPAQLNYTITSESSLSEKIWVINTGDVKTEYDLYFDSQYQSMFTFSINRFSLNPEGSREVNIEYNPSRNPLKDDLNISLYVKGKVVGSTVETGIKVPVSVNHQLDISSTSTTMEATVISGHHYPLTPNDPEILNAFGYLSGIQDSNGGIGGVSTSSWATMAIASSGYDPNDWKKDGNSIVDYLINNRDQIDENKVTDIAKFILALTAANKNPREVQGTDYAAILEQTEDNGQFGDESMYNDDAWAILALISSGLDPTSPQIQNAVSFIKNGQNSDGGWSWHSGLSDADNTASMILALIAAGESKDSPVITNAVNYLKTQLDANGGFTFMGEGNAASDSWALMALASAGLNPTDPEWVKNGVSPVDHLLSLQNSDGSFSWKKGDEGSGWWTSYAVPALLGKSYPIPFEEVTLQYSTTTTTQSLSTTTIDRSGQAYIRIEDLSDTIWRGWVEIPETAQIECYNSGSVYDIPGDNVLAILDKASEGGGFAYQVSDQFYPDIGFYVDSIGGHNSEGEYGWMYRVNYASGDASMDNYHVNSLDNILIYWGTQNVRPLIVEVDHIEVEIGEPFTATVKYRDDSTGEWVPLAEALLHVNDDYTTDQEGKVELTLTEEKVYDIYAEKWGDASDNQFIRSDRIQVGVGIPIPEFSSFLPITASILFAIFYLLLRERKTIPGFDR